MGNAVIEMGSPMREKPNVVNCLIYKHSLYLISHRRHLEHKTGKEYIADVPYTTDYYVYFHYQKRLLCFSSHKIQSALH